jgi:hypothetical protein
MLSFIRPVFEVVKEGRILHFVSGDRKSKASTIDYYLFGTHIDLFKESEWKIRPLGKSL